MRNGVVNGVVSCSITAAAARGSPSGGTGFEGGMVNGTITTGVVGSWNSSSES